MRRVTLLGGPFDGEEITVEDGRPYVRIPVPPSDLTAGYVLEDESVPVQIPEPRVEVYEATWYHYGSSGNLKLVYAHRGTDWGKLRA